MEKKDINELIESAIKGDSLAFEKLYKEKSLMMLYFAHNILNDYHEAQDAVQDAVVLMYKNIKKLKEPQSFNAWMHKIVRNVCIEIMRKKMRRDEEIKEENYFTLVEEDDLEVLPKEYLENEELKEAMADAIHLLPNKRKVALSMYYFEDMSYKEIATSMGISVATVSTSIMRGKAQLKKILEKEKKFDLARYKDFSVAPLIGMAFKADAIKTFTPEIIASIQASCDSAIASATVTGVATTTKLATVVKLISVATVSTAIIVGGILYNTDNLDTNHKKIQNELDPAVSALSDDDNKEVSGKVIEGGSIGFIDGVCDCGHVNPKEAVVEDLNEEGIIVNWVIFNSSGTKIYSGNGTKITSQLKKLYNEKKDGNYILIFDISHKDKGELQLKRSFRIDTGEIEVDQYK